MPKRTPFVGPLEVLEVCRPMYVVIDANGNQVGRAYERRAHAQQKLDWQYRFRRIKSFNTNSEFCLHEKCIIRYGRQRICVDCGTEFSILKQQG